MITFFLTVLFVTLLSTKNKLPINLTLMKTLTMITLSSFHCIYLSFSVMLLTTFLLTSLFVTLPLTEHRLPRNLTQMITLTMITFNGFHCIYVFFSVMLLSTFLMTSFYFVGVLSTESGTPANQTQRVRGSKQGF